MEEETGSRENRPQDLAIRVKSPAFELSIMEVKALDQVREL